MSKSYFRKVAFGIGPDEKMPKDAVSWAKDQVDTVPDLTWQGEIPTGKDLLTRYSKWVYQDRKVLREKHKKDRKAYRKAKDQLRLEVGERYFENLELCIRHDAALNSGAPVFERLWMFWCNHFAITDKDFMPEFTTGPFHRETIRQHMCGSFTELATAATTSWSMIHNLDNSESIGPNSKRGRWRRQNGELATVNENHARELLELHTVSPAAGYTQKDVIALSYIMAGWEHPHSKKRLECNPVKFNPDSHEPGNHKVMGKTYKQRGLSPKSKLLDVIKDLCAHPNCKQFIAFKLCRHFICDEPTETMMQPIIDAWDATDGDLPSIHKALLDVAWTNSSAEKKFQNPEVWLLQLVKMTDAPWPPTPKEMIYDFKSKPNKRQRQPERLLRDLGLSPYRPTQPNGFPDTAPEWLSPELLIRRLAASREIGFRARFDLNYDDVVTKNFDAPEDVLSHLSGASSQQKAQLLFPSYWMLMA